MPLGNDVVDLGHPLNQPDAIHPRFDTRVFTPREIELLDSADDRHLQRWSMWAAKESAFKAARKIDPQVRFLPREFEIEGSVGNPGFVNHRLGRFEVWIDQADEWVHATASQADDKPSYRIADEASAAAAWATAEESERVRRLACAALSERFGVPSDQICIVTVGGLPRAERGGAALPLDLSLSHDGRFVACAWEALGTDSTLGAPTAGATPLPGATSSSTGSESPLRARGLPPGTRTSRP